MTTYNVSSEGATFGNIDTTTLNGAIRTIDTGPAGNYVINITGTISLTSELLAINLPSGSTLTIEGTNSSGGAPQAQTLDGGGTERGLFVYAGTVDINNLTISNMQALGGNGGTQGVGGGGAGLGGGLFVADDTAHSAIAGNVTLTNVTFAHDKATGGNGGFSSSQTTGGGGGGLGGNGGSGSFGGGGGVGVGAVGGQGISRNEKGQPGILVNAAPGGDGGLPVNAGGGPSGGGGGGGDSSSTGGGGGGVGGIDGGHVVGDGHGGFGGGGGGGGFFILGLFPQAPGGGAEGGFGGGGGGGGGDGGFGGGGGGGGIVGPSPGVGGFGGSAGAKSYFVPGGGGSKFGFGGGGLGAGGDIFVQAGASLTIAGTASVGAGTVAAGDALLLNVGQAFANGIYLQGNNTLTFNPTGTVTVAGVIGDDTGSAAAAGYTGPSGYTKGSVGIVVNGTGTLLLEANNTYSGGSTIEAGTLELSALGAAGTGAITFSANANATLTVDNAALASGGAGVLTFTGNTINGFSLGDAIDLSGATFSSAANPPTLGAGNLLQFTENGTTYKVQLDPSRTFSTGFELASDGSGGTQVSLIPASLSVVAFGNGAKVGFPVSAIATPDAADAAAVISYQWQSSADNGATWNPISGATGSSYVVQASDGNKLVRAHASFTVENQLVSADSIAFNGPVAPDLTVSSISAAGSIASGDMLSFSYAIKNIGAGDDTVSSWAGVFLDNNFAATFRNNTWNLIGPILAGNTVRTSNSISTVGLALGDHTLTVEADYWNDATGMKNNGNDDVAESNEANNATTVHFTVQQAAAPAALPDLVVDSITNPSVVNQGDAFSFSYVIKDIGTGDVHAASWAGIFLDGQVTTLLGGTPPSGWNYISAMAAGGSVTASNSFSTAGLLGSHTLTIEADYWNDATGMTNNGSDDVAESNEGNNSTTIHFTVNAPVAPVLPDLVVDSITPNAASVHQGDNFSFSYVIKDTGAGAVNTANWAGIFLDGQVTTLLGGTSPSGWNRIAPIAAGASVTALDSFSTAGLGLGDHTLTVEADYWNDAGGKANSANNDITESNENNNTTTIHFTVTAPALPDLVVDSITPAATSVALGQSLNFSYVIKDIGAGGVHANSWDGIFLDNNFSSTYQGKSFNLIGTLDAGGSVTASNSISTAGLALGDHTLTIKADYWNDATGMPNSGNNDVAESNEANNATTVHFIVTAAAQQAQILAVNAPVTVGSGQTVEISSPYSGAVTFAADTGTLQLDDPASFSGTVAGMTGQDAIDFANIDPTKVQPPSYDSASGTLHVTDGAHSANIALIGNYMASVFVPSSDGHGGTSVVDPPATASTQTALLAQPHA